MKKSFISSWTELLWEAMSNTGKGYKKQSMKRSGVGEDRREDKKENNERKMFRSYRNRYSV